MDTLLYLIATYGLLVVFVSVLLDQGGIPIPAYPPIIVTTAVAVDAGESYWPVLIVATIAAVAADWLWFIGGRRLGAKLVRLMCRLSLSPDSCVLHHRGIYARWGAASLMVAKFVPGFAAVATTLAGETGTSTRRFLMFDGIGALLWSGVAVALGVIVPPGRRGQRAPATRGVGPLRPDSGDPGPDRGVHRVEMVATASASCSELRMARITADELHELIESGAAPLILDVRSTGAARKRAAGSPARCSCDSLPDDAEIAPHEEGRRVLRLPERSLRGRAGARTQASWLPARAAARRWLRGVACGGRAGRRR